MKRILTFMAVLAVLAGITSCSKEENAVTKEKTVVRKQVTLNASFSENTKVEYSETDGKKLHPSWEIGDVIVGIDEDNKTFTLTVTAVKEDGKQATLFGEAPENGDVCLIYKRGATAQDWKDNAMAVDYKGQAGDKTMPAIMLSEGTITDRKGSFSFRNAGAVVGICNAIELPANAQITDVIVKGDNLSAAAISILDNKLSLKATEKADDEISLSISNVTVGSDEARTLENPIFIAVPAGAKIAEVTVIYDGALYPYTYTLKSKKDVAANKYLYINDQPFIAEAYYTVNKDHKKVTFAPGNLYCTRSGSEGNWSYSFAMEANQWDYRGFYGDLKDKAVIDGKETKTPENTSGHFQWVSATCKGDDSYPDQRIEYVEEARKNYGAFSLLFENALQGQSDDLVNYGKAYGDGKTWYTLTYDEWNYVLTNAKRMLPVEGVSSYYGNNCVIAEVGTGESKVKGLMIFPDKYLGNKTGLTYIPEGCAFLPLAGFRKSDGSLNEMGEYGNYNGGDAGMESFNTLIRISINPKDSSNPLNVTRNSRSMARAVRLAKDF